MCSIRQLLAHNQSDKVAVNIRACELVLKCSEHDQNYLESEEVNS